MFIVHGTIHSESKQFLLWGESDTPSVRKVSRRSKTRSHPFALSADQLENWLINLVPHAQPELQSFQFWLPGNAEQPQASPELRATGAFVDDDAQPSAMHRW